MNQLIKHSAGISLCSGNFDVKVHCLQPNSRTHRPICGKKKPGEFTMSRDEFRQIKVKNQCKRCARTRFARFI